MNKLLLFLLFPVLGFSQTAQRWNVAIQPTSGSNFSVVIPNAQVSVCTWNDQLSCDSPNLVIYADTALTQQIDQPLQANAAGTYFYYVQAGTHLVEKVCAPYNQCSFYDIYVGSSAGGTGSSLCGPLPGDVTSTRCGTDALSHLTGSNLSLLSGFGFETVSYVSTVGESSFSEEIVGVGDQSGSHITNGVDIVGIGDSSAIQFSASTFDIIGIGDGSANTIGGQSSDIIAIGNGSGSHIGSNVDDVVAIGNGAGANLVSTSSDVVGIGNGSSSSVNSTGTLTIVVGIGVGAASNHGTGVFNNVVGIGNGSGSESDPTFSSDYTDVIGIGDGAAGAMGTVSDVIGIGHRPLICNTGSEVIALGTLALGGYYNGANCEGVAGNACSNDIAIGQDALAGNTTGTNNVAIGTMSGANGYTAFNSIGNSNTTGSHNTWVGDYSGPNTTSQLTNTIALGYQAYNTVSNQTVIGNNSITQAVIYGDVEINGGTNTVYRCATSGSLPAGALTIVSGSCGTTTDTGLRVQ